AIAERGPECPQQKCGPPTQPLGPVVDQAICKATHPKTHDVDEGQRPSLPKVVDQFDNTQVNGPRTGRGQPGNCCVDVVRQAKSLAKVPSGPRRDQRQVGPAERITPLREVTLGDFVQGAVAADSRNSIDSPARSLSCQARGVVR